MKYYSAIISLFISSIFLVILLLYFANLSRQYEKENYLLKTQIKKVKDQININEIEYSLYNSYDYLQKMQKVYFNESDKIQLNKRVDYSNLKNKNIENFYTVGIK